MKLKRLFTVGTGSNKQYFNNKMKAKEFRDNLIAYGVSAHVSRGPDHIGKHGTRITNRKHRANKMRGRS